MNNVTNLSKLNCFPELVDGKVIIVSDLSYDVVSASKYCDAIPENFDPHMFSLLVTDKYKCIINASPRERRDRAIDILVNKYYDKHHCTDTVVCNHCGHINYKNR